MGTQQSKPSAKKITKMEIQILCMKLREYLNLQKDRRSNQVIKQEKYLITLITSNSRNKQEETLCINRIINHLKYISASRLLASYADILKSNALFLADAQGDKTKIKQLIPYIQSLIFATLPMNLNALSDFKKMMIYLYGQQLYDTSNSPNIPLQLKASFQKLIPSQVQVNTYALQMCFRNQISLQKFNKIGHNIKQPTIQKKTSKDQRAINQIAKTSGGYQTSSNQINQRQYGIQTNNTIKNSNLSQPAGFKYSYNPYQNIFKSQKKSSQNFSYPQPSDVFEP